MWEWAFTSVCVRACVTTHHHCCIYFIERHFSWLIANVWPIVCYSVHQHAMWPRTTSGLTVNQTFLAHNKIDNSLVAYFTGNSINFCVALFILKHELESHKSTIHVDVQWLLMVNIFSWRGKLLSMCDNCLLQNTFFHHQHCHVPAWMKSTHMETYRF